MQASTHLNHLRAPRASNANHFCPQAKGPEKQLRKCDRQRSFQKREWGPSKPASMPQRSARFLKLAVALWSASRASGEQDLHQGRGEIENAFLPETSRKQFSEDRPQQAPDFEQRPHKSINLTQVTGVLPAHPRHFGCRGAVVRIRDA